MKLENITYNPLKTDFTYKGFRHVQLYRDGDFAIFHKVAMKGQLHLRDKDAGFEVVIVGRHNGYEIAGNKVEPAEVYPSNEKWGSMGWTYIDLFSATKRLERLLKGDIPENVETEPEDELETEEVPVEPKQQGQGQGRGRPRKEQGPITIPEGGEFTMQEIAALNNMDKPNMYIVIKEFIAQGKVKELRRESRGKGRPTVIYGTVSA